MQDGLHIGLAAWICAQREQDGFVAWPASPIATGPAALHSVQTMNDLERIAEFARLVNFTPRKSRYAGPFAAEGVLWEVHRQLLGRMHFAPRPWTPAEDDAWREAREVLHETGPDGHPRMSTVFRLYDEHRIGYADLQACGADAGTLAAAHAAWLAVGFKLEVESAVATLNRLAQRSSVMEATEERLELEPAALPATADSSYAATTFSPMSAVDTGTWMSGETTIDDLDRAVGDSGPRGRWDAWRTARSGTVRFRYVALEVLRSWFTPRLYSADDWRVDDGPVVSDGDGVGGELPAFVSSVYVVVVDQLRTSAPAPRPLPAQVRIQPVGPVADVHPNRPLPLRTHLAAPATFLPRGGVLAAPRIPDTVALQSDAVARGPVLRAALPDHRTGRFGQIRLVTMADVSSRLAVADRLVGARPHDMPTPVVGTPYVVGFGCAQLPVAPAPNPDYQW